MKLADVYPKYPAKIVRAAGCHIWDEAGRQILDFYSGHGVISIGHQHPRFVERLKSQLDELAYYSNAVELPLQTELAENLGRISGREGDQLFLVNSGAEAVENALKVASFHNGRKRVIAFRGAFHGRTALAVQCSDSSNLAAPINQGLDIIWLEQNDEAALQEAMDDRVCAVIIEGIQGIGGIHQAENTFLQLVRKSCDQHGACLIIDEIQSGFGRSGKFFAHQWAGVRPDIITMAKGMGNGFPVGGIIVDPNIQLDKGMLGTTFGGSPLACAASLAVIEVLQGEDLIEQAARTGEWLKEKLKDMPYVTCIRGRGLMIGVDFAFPTAPLRSKLFHQMNVIVGSASSPETIRLLPPLTASQNEGRMFLEALEQALAQLQ